MDLAEGATYGVAESATDSGRARRRFWRDFCSRYRELQQHWATIEDDVFDIVDDGLQRTVTVLDFEREAAMVLDRRLRDPEQTDAPVRRQQSSHHPTDKRRVRAPPDTHSGGTKRVTNFGSSRSLDVWNFI
eukprot:TRINITY_DN30085_c0_g1_i1.p2 TRINITY_DN30085_c0_g1~~TRINITY_DN30085_c0_g1_i1.p2  ORF type:complete len:149 (+),score=6.74 TRINITY_DN30085_c0_g1_i1:55-447(+)